MVQQADQHPVKQAADAGTNHANEIKPCVEWSTQSIGWEQTIRKEVIVKTSVSIPIIGSRWMSQNVQVKFPLQCVYCGRQVETQVLVDLYNSAQAGGKKVDFSIKLNLPYCHEHAALSARYSKQYERLMTLLVIAVLLIAIVAWNISSMPTESFLVPVVFGAVAIALTHKISVAINPKFRDIPALFQQGALGVTIKLHVIGSAGIRLDFQFSNADYAAAFALLNDATVSPL